QAEDGIRDFHVTGVQTCALPISTPVNEAAEAFEILLELQERLPRGPRREGAFAVWLVARQAWDQANSGIEFDRGDRKRLALLEKRLAPLAIPRPLARGLATAIAHLGDATPQAARIALSQMVAPARESVGNEAGEALALMVRELHTRRQQLAE